MGAVLVQSMSCQTNPPTSLCKMVHASSVSYVQLYWTCMVEVMPHFLLYES